MTLIEHTDLLYPDTDKKTYNQQKTNPSSGFSFRVFFGLFGSYSGDQPYNNDDKPTNSDYCVCKCHAGLKVYDLLNTISHLI